MATTTIKNSQADIDTLNAAIDKLNARGSSNQEAALRFVGAADNQVNPYTFDQGIYLIGNTNHATTNHEWPAKNMWGFLIKPSPANTGTTIGIILAQGKIYWGYRSPANDQTKNTWYTVSATESSYN